MDRYEKLKALKSISDGKPVAQAFKEINLILVKSETETQILGYKDKPFINNSEVEAFIVEFKAKNPFKLVTVTRLNKAEYDAIEEKLEREY